MENNFDDQRLNVDLADYWIIIRKRFLLIILVFVLIISLAALYTLKQIPVYEASCQIQISSRQPMATIQGSQVTWYGSKGNEINNEIKLITNKTEILDAVLFILKTKRINSNKVNTNDEDTQNLDENLKYYTQDEVMEVQRLTFNEKETRFINSLSPGALKGMISIDTLGQSNIVAIKTEAPFQSVAVSISNILAMVYRADYWRSKTLEAEKARNFIGQQIELAKSKLEKQAKQIETTTQKRTFMGSSDVYQQELTTLRIQLDKLMETYKPVHPRIIKQKKLIQSIEKQLEKFPVAKVQADENQFERESLQQTIINLTEHFIVADINYQAKKQEAKDQIQIISPAVSASKLKPNEPMNIAVGALFGLILGCLVAFVWEGLDTSIGKIEDVERITQLPVIAHIPLIGQRSKYSTFFSPIKRLWKMACRIFLFFFPFFEAKDDNDYDEKLIFNLPPLSVESEAYRTLRTNIHFAIGTGHQQSGHVIAMTSTSPREGKTLTSTNLAIEIAQMGKTVMLVEADMRRPQIATLFKISEKPGLSDLLLGTDPVDTCTRTITDILMGDSEWDKLMETQGIDNLHILPCGTVPPNPTELLLSREFKNLINDFKAKYDFIIIDTPPTLPVSDSSIISTVVDGTVLIYQSDKTSRHLLLRAIQTLKKNQANLLGIVINQLSFDVILRSNRGNYAYSYHKK